MVASCTTVPSKQAFTQTGLAPAVPRIEVIAKVYCDCFAMFLKLISSFCASPCVLFTPAHSSGRHPGGNWTTRGRPSPDPQAWTTLEHDDARCLSPGVRAVFMGSRLHVPAHPRIERGAPSHRTGSLPAFRNGLQAPYLTSQSTHVLHYPSELQYHPA